MELNVELAGSCAERSAGGVNGKTSVSTTANVVVTFSEPVQNVTGTTFLLNQSGNGTSCSAPLGTAITGTITGNATKDIWTFDPTLALLKSTLYCVTVATGVTDTTGLPLTPAFASSFKTGTK